MYLISKTVFGPMPTDVSYSALGGKLIESSILNQELGWILFNSLFNLSEFLVILKREKYRLQDRTCGKKHCIHVYIYTISLYSSW